jgi:hypothetical protein
MSGRLDMPAAAAAGEANPRERTAGAGAVASSSGPAGTGDVYIEDSARSARRTLEPFGWPDERWRVCLDACEPHHAFTTRWWMAAEVELVRRSDFVEVYPELRRFGIPRAGMFRRPGPGQSVT